MLHEFLLAERDEILALCSKKIARLADSMSSSDEMERGLPVFYDELIEVLRADANTDESGEAHNNGVESVHRAAAERRGKSPTLQPHTLPVSAPMQLVQCQSMN